MKNSNTDIYLPLVSICIPTYNGAKYLEDALKSAISQTYKNIEILISDDQSKDNTLEIARKYQKIANCSYKIVSHTPNGIGANWNNCVRLAEGEYIKFLFQDDILLPECIERMMEIAIKDSKLGLVFSKRTFLDENNNDYFLEWKKKYQDLHIYWKDLQPINSGNKLLKECDCLLESPLNKVGEPTAVLLKKSIFKRTGYFNEDLVQLLDYEFWYRVFKFYKIGFVDKELIQFRLHAEQTTQNNTKKEIKDYDIYYKLLYKNLFFDLSPNVQKKLLLDYNTTYQFYIRLKRKLKKNIKSIWRERY